MEKDEYGIFMKKDNKYVLIRDGFFNRSYAEKRALTLEKKFNEEKGFEVKLCIRKIKRV